MPQFDNDRDEVIKRSLDAGVWMINAGADNETSIKGVELANKYNEGVYATVGLHPTEEARSDERRANGNTGWNYEFFKKLAQDKKVVAIGECGLDYYTRNNAEQKQALNGAEKERQKDLFVKHILLAKEVKKPLVIHCREAFEDLIEILELNVKSKMLNDLPGVLHFFTGNLNDAQMLLKLGFYFTFGGLITFSRDFDEIIKFIPLDRIMVETDAPYVAPVPFRGKRNEPAYVIEVAKKLAEIKGISFEEVCKQTTENARKVFGIIIP